MDQWAQVGPDKPGYERDIANIRERLAAGQAVDVPFAARMTAHHVLLVRLTADLRYGTRPPGFTSQNALFVGVAGRACAYVPADWPLHWSDLEQVGKAYGDYEHDHPFVDFLNAINGFASAPEDAGSLAETGSSGAPVAEATSG